MFKRLKRIFKPNIYPSDKEIRYFKGYPPLTETEIYLLHFFNEYDVIYYYDKGIFNHEGIVILFEEGDDEYIVSIDIGIDKAREMMRKRFPLEWRNEEVKRIMKIL